MQFLDAKTRRQLDFDEVWSRIRPVSSLGKARQRKASAFLPGESAALRQELDRVERLSVDLGTDPRAADDLTYLLSTVRDITGSLHRSTTGFILDDMEFYEVKKLLLTIREIQAELGRLGWTSLLPSPLDLCTECKEALSIGQGSRDSFYIADAYHEKLAHVRAERSRLESSLARFRTSVQDKIMQTADRLLSMDDEITVSTTEDEMIRQLAAITELRKVQETAEFVKFRLVEDEGVGQIRLRLVGVRDEEEECKNQIRRQLTEVVKCHAQRLLSSLEQLGFLDLLLAKARFCAEFNGTKPQLCADPIIRIKAGRHLLLEEDVKVAGHDYTPLDIQLKAGVTMITGPNMGGKTASLKTIGLLTAMAQFGLLVPAACLEFRPRRFIAAHLAAAEIPGLSAFAGEITFLCDVIKNSSQDALILVDEIAHGTNPEEGAGIAQAIIEKLHGEPSITVMTTHYPSLARLEGIYHLRVKGLDKEKLGQMQVDDFQFCMDYGLEAANPDQPLMSDAVIVAEAMGLDRSIIGRTKELLKLNTSTKEGELA